MSSEKDIHKTRWKNKDLPLHLKKAREEQKCSQLNLLGVY
jgi:hypothetical protein